VPQTGTNSASSFARMTDCHERNAGTCIGFLQVIGCTGSPRQPISKHADDYPLAVVGAILITT
jgi:hypothetical protein